MMFNFGKVRTFNSKSYNLDLVKEKDEFEFLRNTLRSFIESGDVRNMLVLTSENHKANIHIATKNRTLIKLLLRFGFEEA